MNILLEEASHDHIDHICRLINMAYRGNDGWTTETQIVDGDRTNPDEIKSILSNHNKKLLIVRQNENLVSCVCLERKNECSYISMFAVNPVYQDSGIGKQVLSQAEDYSMNVLNLKKFAMIVVSSRTELISYYERRGYVLTGKTAEYPVHLNVGIPKVSGLSLVYLEKNA